MISIRRRLFLSLLFSFIVCIAAMMIYVFFQTRHELTEIFDNNMRETAELLRDTEISALPPPPSASLPVSGNKGRDRLILQVWDKDGRFIRSLPPHDIIPLNTKLRDGNARTPGYRWQTHTIKTHDGGYIQISRSEKMAAHLIEENAQQALVPFMVLFFLLGAGAWILIGNSMTPLNALSGEIARRRADQLDPIIMENVPIEAKPIIEALNALLGKLAAALEMQRRFTADAAHELRTPLTALRLQTDLLKKAQSESDRQDALRHLEAGIDRSARLVHQLLEASRSSATPAIPSICDLSEIIREVAAEFSILAKRKNIRMQITHQTPLPVQADAGQARSLISNLLDNAIRYTPDGGEVTLACNADTKHVTMNVCDTGPGIPVEEREKIFQRFYRVPGTKETGSGLGLSIVHDIAVQIGATVHIAEGPKGQGAFFSVFFKKPEQPPGQ